MVDPVELRLLAARAAREAGSLLLDGLDEVRTDVQTKSSGTDMVSEMDRAAEACIAECILAVRPEDALVGEEGMQRGGISGVRWIVDPLDGTTNYLYGLAGFGVSIAAEVQGTVVAGVVLDVIRDEMFAATLGGGATRNDQPIAASDATELSVSLIATGFSYDAARRARQAAVLAGVLPLVRDIRRFGAAAVDLCAVACGRVDGYYENGLAIWDLAAGALIASEAGAVVTDFEGGTASPGAVVAAAPGIATALRDLLARAGASTV
ncbi:MAG: inositol monophosphatase family protein [Acidimicrobiales bacterium]